MWLDELRKMKSESGLTTKEISNRSGIPEPTLEKLFAGATKDPKLTTIQQLVHFFGHTLNDLTPDASTDIKKEPAPKGDEPGDPHDVQLMELLCRMTPDQKKWLLEKIDTLLELQ